MKEWFIISLYYILFDILKYTFEMTSPCHRPTGFQAILCMVKHHKNNDKQCSEIRLKSINKIRQFFATQQFKEIILLPIPLRHLSYILHYFLLSGPPFFITHSCSLSLKLRITHFLIYLNVLFSCLFKFDRQPDNVISKKERRKLISS